MNIEKLVEEGIVAIIPVYVKDGGDYCNVYTKKGGSYEIRKGFKYVRRKLCKYFHVDLKAVKADYEKNLLMSRLIPIPCSKEDIFIYVKVRKPICEKDWTHALVNLKYIKEELIEQDDKTVIKLPNNVKIECLATIENVKKHIANGRTIKELYNGKIDNANGIKDNKKVIIMGDVVFMGGKETEEEIHEKKEEMEQKLAKMNLSIDEIIRNKMSN